MNKQISFEFSNFDASAAQASAEIREDIAGGVYIFGALGCGKTRETVKDALQAYLGGRELIAHRII